MEGWCEFKARMKNGSRIMTKLDAGHEKTVQENRQYMRAVIESLRFTACQTIAQRGHREDQQSTNRGNFIELLNLLGKFDTIVSKKLSSGPGNAKYMHHDIQDELIDVMASMVREQVSNEVKLGEHFALMVDETKDVSKKEQISVALRYLNNDMIHEEFLDFISAEGLDAESLHKSVKQTLAKCSIDKHACIAQCYDGASVMSGCNNGVQERFRQEVPHALYIHCYAHRLNLVLVDCVHNVKPVAECFATVKMLYNFFSGTVTHKVFMEKQQELEPTKRTVELKRLSDTRWACQYSTLWAIKRTLPALLATLVDVSNQTNAHRATEARSLIGLIDAQFVVHICMLESIFKLTKNLSDHLQTKDLELASAIDLVFAVVDTLNDKRNAETWTEIWECASDMCETVGIDMQRPQDFVVNSQTGSKEPLETSEDYQNHCYFPVINRLISELDRRFSSDSCHVLKGATALNPKHETFLDKDTLLPMAEHYGVLIENLSAELHQLKRLIERKNQRGDVVSTTHDVLVLLRPYKDAFVDLFKLVCISMTLPVTSASCERSFSCLRRLKTYLRNKSGDARTSNLGVLAISSSRAKALDVEAVINRFAANHNNRRIVLL
ncbi:zinc finger MYM-type protein 1-like [Eleginops maclovinus]|uniref:zinc finger MYM-type protein 1-like n=1 Tax=Eleginops maclovinus TaxID=56733 RepID=UPI0030800E93